MTVRATNIVSKIFVVNESKGENFIEVCGM